MIPQSRLEEIRKECREEAQRVLDALPEDRCPESVLWNEGFLSGYREGAASQRIKAEELHAESIRLLETVTDSRFHDHNEPKYCSMCRHIEALSTYRTR